MEKTNGVLFDAQPNLVGVTIKASVEKCWVYCLEQELCSNLSTTLHLTTNFDLVTSFAWVDWLLLRSDCQDQHRLMADWGLLINRPCSRLNALWSLDADWRRLGRLSIWLHRLILVWWCLEFVRTMVSWTLPDDLTLCFRSLYNKCIYLKSQNLLKSLYLLI